MGTPSRGGTDSSIGCNLIGSDAVGGMAPGETAAEASAVRTMRLPMLGRSLRVGRRVPQTGFDCSGLVQYVYREVGVLPARVAQDQYDAGPAVPPGDTRWSPATWCSSAPGPTTVSHVGMYVGDGLMIDAPHTGSVVRFDQSRGLRADRGSDRSRRDGRPTGTASVPVPGMRKGRTRGHRGHTLRMVVRRGVGFERRGFGPFVTLVEYRAARRGAGALEDRVATESKPEPPEGESTWWAPPRTGAGGSVSSSRWGRILFALGAVPGLRLAGRSDRRCRDLLRRLPLLHRRGIPAVPGSGGHRSGRSARGWRRVFVLQPRPYRLVGHGHPVGRAPSTSM